ncbi:MAG: hypothetical protein G3M70_16415 [Candidatus Nitronauta litoralis]|uniref:Uncharacterized protein n=1 Tax=Candidatus Nitronauta litoralis TaxID=2705533 RepID=A0A7T0BYN7_9BACT|nr:MAG: hypothetical protein G3M70_16415 [Candidatus Nitronauta litoralis]
MTKPLHNLTIFIGAVNGRKENCVTLMVKELFILKNEIEELYINTNTAYDLLCAIITTLKFGLRLTSPSIRTCDHASSPDLEHALHVFSAPPHLGAHGAR